MTKQYKINCKRCGLIISSDFEDQFNYNLKQHLEAHKREEEKKDRLKVEKAMRIKRGKGGKAK